MSENIELVKEIFEKQKEEIEESFNKIKRASYLMGKLQALIELKNELLEELNGKISEFEKKKLEEIGTIEQNGKNVEEYKARIKEIELKISELEDYIKKMKELSNLVERRIEREINKILEAK